MTSTPLSLVGVDLGVWGVERNRDLAVVTVFYEVLGYVCECHLGIQIFTLTLEPLYPPVRGQTVIVTLVTENQGCFVDGRVVVFYNLLEFFRRESPGDSLG
jgi:hypothetical protein